MLLVLGQNMTPICLAKLYFINLSIHQDPKNNWRVSFKIQKIAHFSLVSLSIHPRSRRGAERTRQGEGCLSRPLKTALERSDSTEKFQFRESHTQAETKKAPDQIPVLSKTRIIVYIDTPKPRDFHRFTHTIFIIVRFRVRSRIHQVRTLI